MSDNTHRPFGDPDPFDADDLHQEPTTDAPDSDADALDAWLNEIPHTSGVPGTRSGSGQTRPNSRIDDHDATGYAASLIEAADRFHRRIVAAQSHDARAAEPDPQLWETIMERTAAEQPVPTPANPWTTPPRDGKPVRRRQIESQDTPPQVQKRAMPSQRVWNTVANIGLITAILLAVVGAWRLSGGPGLPSGSNDSPTAPGFAMQASPPAETPAMSEQDVITAPPVATPAPTTDCDFSPDIPIFNSVDESPWDGTAVLLTTSGDLILTCPEEPEPTVLASGVEHASALDWPGILSITFADVGDDPEAQYEEKRAVVNVMTGAVLPIGTRPTGYHDLNQHPGSPWLVAPSIGFQGDWAIIDLRTMQEKPLSDYEADQFNGRVIHDVTTSANGNDDTLVIANQFSNTYGGGIIDPNNPAFHELASSNVAMQYGPLINNDVPGSLLVLDGSLDEARWLSLPREDQTYIDIQLSPDGEYLALTSVDAEFQSVDRDPAGEVRGDILYSIMRLSDGAEIVQSQPTADQAEEYGTEMLWLADSSGLAYTYDGAVHVLPTDPAAEPYTLYEGDGALRSLRPTTDPARIIVSATPQNEMGTVDPQAGTQRILSISIASSVTFELSGHVTHDYLQMHHLLPEVRFMVLRQPEGNGGQTTTYHLVDVVTGRVVEEVTTTVDVAGMGKGAITSTFDGEVTIASFGAQHIYLMRVFDDVEQIRELSTPETLGNPTGSVGVLVSPDGGTAFVGQASGESQTVVAVSAEDERGEWTPVPAYPSFVRGTGD